MIGFARDVGSTKMCQQWLSVIEKTNVSLSFGNSLLSRFSPRASKFHSPAH